MSHKALEKIKKCLALAKSSNPNEAATALRQAQALMKKYGVTDETLELSDVESCTVSAGDGKKPPNYIAMLITLVKQAFAVDAVYKSHQDFFDSTYKSNVDFIGFNEAPEIASYAYDVLLRQLKKGRSDYLKTLNSRLKRTTKIKRGDLYAEGWIVAVRKQVIQQHITGVDLAIIETWKAKEYPHLTTGKTINRTTKTTTYDAGAFTRGKKDGEKVRLYQGVNTEKPPALEAL